MTALTGKVLLARVGVVGGVAIVGVALIAANKAAERGLSWLHWNGYLD